MFSNEILCSYFAFGCVLCVLHFLDHLTLYTSSCCVLAVCVVHYYFHKRDENFRHRLSVLGLAKHEKRERKVDSRPSPDSGRTDSWKIAGERHVRTMGTSFSPRHVGLSGGFGVRGRPLSASSGRESSAFLNSLSFVNKSVVEPQRKRTVGLRSPRNHSLDWEPAFHRRYPVQQEKYAVGKYPAVCLSKSSLPTAKLFGEQDGVTPVKVKILPLSSSPKQRVTLSPQFVESGTEAHKQDPCSTEAVLKALKERRKRAAVSGQDDADKGEASKRQRKDNLVSPTSALPTSTYCPTSLPSFGGIVRSRAPEKRPHNSMQESPGDSSKRVRNNAIFVSFCSSRSLLESGHAHKRKASTCETSPQMKITRKDDRALSPSMEDREAAIKDNPAASPAEERKDETTSTPSSETTRRNVASSSKREFLPSDQSVRKKKLLFPEHVATMQEHEQDSLLEKQRLDLMLGSINDLYQKTKPAVTSLPQVVHPATTPAAPKTAISATFPLTAQQLSTTSASVGVLSTSTQVTQALKSPAVTFGVSTSGAMGSQPSTGAQRPAVNASTSCLTVLKTTPPTTVTPSFQLQAPCSKPEVVVSTLAENKFVAAPASTVVGQSAPAVTTVANQTPALHGFSLAPISAVSTSSKTGVSYAMPGLSLPFTTTAAPVAKTTNTTSAGELSKSAPFVFGSAPSTRSPFTFSARGAESSQPSPAPVSQAATIFSATPLPNPVTTQPQGSIFSAPSKMPSSAMNTSAVNSTIKSPPQQTTALFFAPTSSAPGITQAAPISAPSTTLGGIKFAPAPLGGFSFPTTPANSPIVANGVNGIGSTAAHVAPAFKFGAGSSGDAPLNTTFTLPAQPLANSTPFVPKQNSIFGSTPGALVAAPVVNNSLFSIGTGARSERPIATARSRRTTRK